MSSEGSKRVVAETASVTSKKTTKSAASTKSAPRIVIQKEVAEARPVRPARSLRERVLERAASRRSSISEGQTEQSLPSPPPLPEMPPPSQMDISCERVASWNQEGIPPRTIESDGELSEESSISESTTGRPSMLVCSTRRTGVEMDAATKLANETLLRAKEAIESAGNMKRECKLIALEGLQTLYETVLSLSDSRSRHKNNLEKERVRHAQELVRVERAHTKATAELIKNMSQSLGEARADLTDNLEETRAVRSWLGYETREPFSKIDEMARAIVKLESSIDEVAKTVQRGSAEPAKTPNAVPTSIEKLDTKLASLSAQIDELRRDVQKVKVGTDQLVESRKGPNISPTSIEAVGGLHRKIDAGLEDLKTAVKQTEERLLKATSDISPPTENKTDIKEQLQPLTERLEAVSSELRTIRENRAKTPPPVISLEAELALAGGQQTSKPTYAQMARKPKEPRPNHTLIISSTDPNKTGENVIEVIRKALDQKKSGARVDRVRKGRNQKVILSCSTSEDLKQVANDTRDCKDIEIQFARAKNPLVRIKDVLAYHSDAEMLDKIKTQNKEIFQGLSPEDSTIKIRYRKAARNPLECHPVLETSPEVHKRLMEAGKVYIGLQRRPVLDQSPLVQCTKCLGFGHTRVVCKEETQLCSFCGEAHTWDNCPRREQGRAPNCRNCTRAENKTTNRQHVAFSEECPERQRWDLIARSKITYLC